MDSFKILKTEITRTTVENLAVYFKSRKRQNRCYLQCEYSCKVLQQFINSK